MTPNGKALGEARAYLAGLGADILELCGEIGLDGADISVDTYDEPTINFKGFMGDRVALSFIAYPKVKEESDE